MSDAQIGLLLMGCPIGLTGIVTGFYAANTCDLFDRMSRIVGMYFLTVFLYFVGLLTYQPTAMANSSYCPIAYAVAAVIGGVVALLISTGLFWGFFWLLNLGYQKVP